MADQKQTESFLKTVFEIAVAIVFILVAVFGILEFVDWRIEQAMNDEQFIRKVASNIRPYVIFDVNDSILVDGGAMQALEQIKVERGKKDGSLPVKIIVTPRYHLAHPPLLEKIGAGRFILTPNPRRGLGHQWVYEFEVVHWEADETPLCFRLEIVK